MIDEQDVKKLNGGRAFPVGSLPISLAHQFLDENDEPYDLTSGGWTGQARAEQLYVDSQPAGIGAGSVSIDVPSATATYDWAAADFETDGDFLIIIWIGNGTQRFGSTIYHWKVVDAPGADPTV